MLSSHFWMWKWPMPIAPEEVWEVVRQEGEKHNLNPSLYLRLSLPKAGSMPTLIPVMRVA